MNLLLVLLCVVAYHYCNGYPVIEGEKSEKVTTGQDFSIADERGLANHTSLMNSSVQPDLFKNIEQINNITMLELRIKIPRYGNATEMDTTWVWVLLGVVISLVLLWQCCKKDEKEKDPNWEVQNNVENSYFTRDIGMVNVIPLPYK